LNNNLEISELYQVICKELDKTSLTYSHSEGAWYTWIDFDNYMSLLTAKGIKTSGQLSLTLANDLGLVTVPAECFGSNDMALRLSMVDHNLPEGIKKLACWLNV